MIFSVLSHLFVLAHSQQEHEYIMFAFGSLILFIWYSFRLPPMQTIYAFHVSYMPDSMAERANGIEDARRRARWCVRVWLCVIFSHDLFLQLRSNENGRFVHFFFSINIIRLAACWFLSPPCLIFSQPGFFFPRTTQVTDDDDDDGIRSTAYDLCVSKCSGQMIWLCCSPIDDPKRASKRDGVVSTDS